MSGCALGYFLRKVCLGGGVLKKKKKCCMLFSCWYGGNTSYTMGIGLLDAASAIIYVFCNKTLI